jgi:Tol biopolymer transport system component
MTRTGFLLRTLLGLAAALVLLILAAKSAAVLLPQAGQIAFSRQTGVGDLILLDVRTSIEHNLTPNTPLSLERAPSWSPDGRRLVYASTRAGIQRLWVLDLMTASTQPLPLDSARNFVPSSPVWSPDGTQLAFELDRDVWLFDLASGERRRLLENAVDPRWSPDGQTVAARGLSNTPQVWFVSVDDGTTRARLLGWLHHLYGLAWSPDGGHMLIIGAAHGRSIWSVSVHVVALDCLTTCGDAESAITSASGMDVHAAWSPDGAHIAFTCPSPFGMEICLRDLSDTQIRQLTHTRRMVSYRDLAWRPGS